MKTTELRIGNYVTWNGPDHKERAVIAGISNHDVVFKCGDYGEPDELEPILITEEWLVKLKDWNFIGFGTRKIYQHFEYLALKIEMTGDNQIAIYFNDELLSFKKYIHGFQNLYFSLTQKELTI